MTREIGRMRSGLLVLALAAMLPVTEAEQSWWVFLIAAGCALTSEALGSMFPKFRMPRVIVHLMALGCVVFLCFEMFALRGQVPAILALSHFLTFLCCCKFFELRGPRDMGLVLIIGLLLMIVGGLVSGSIVYPIVLAFVLTFGIGWLIVFHQRREADAVLARGGVLAEAARPDGAARLLPIGRVARSTLIVSAVLLVAAGATFVIVPRGMGRQLFGQIRAPIPGAVTGYTDQVQLNDEGVAESDRMVMRVRLSRAGRPFGGEDFPLYLRGRSLHRYNGMGWAPTPSSTVWWQVQGSSLDQPGELSSAAHTLPPEQRIRQDIWLERGEGPYCFCLYPPLSLATGDAGDADQDCDDLSLRFRKYRGRAVHYVVESAAAVSGRLADTLVRESEERVRSEIGADLLREYRQRRQLLNRGGRSRIPGRVRELAAQLVRDIGDPENPALHGRMARRIRDFLTGDDFRYTLDPVPRGTDGDRVESFLFETRRGHCEYFASAMTMMCQALGLEARVATGYLATEFNPVGGFYVVRRRDAHAWVEVHLPDVGWVTFDPSPAGETRRARRREGLLASLVRLGDYAQFEWATFVVSFDAEHRRQLFGKFEGWFRRSDEARAGVPYLADLVLAFFRGPPELAPPQRVLYWVMLALALIMFVLILRVVWILLLMAAEYLPARPIDGTPHRRRPAARFYDRLLVALGRRGYTRPAALTPHEFALHVAAIDDELEPVIELTEWYYQVQYGGRTLDRSQRAAIKEFLRFLREGLPIGRRARPNGGDS